MMSTTNMKTTNWRKAALRELRGYCARLTLALNGAALAQDAAERDAFVERARVTHDQLTARAGAMLEGVAS